MDTLRFEVEVGQTEGVDVGERFWAFWVLEAGRGYVEVAFAMKTMWSVGFGDSSF